MVEFRPVKQEEMEDWFYHCMIVFNKGEYSDYFAKYFRAHWYNDPWRELDTIFVAVEDGKILSTVRLLHRKVYLGDQEVNMGAIGEVSTKPEAVGKGMATRLLRMAIEEMEKRKMEISMLGAGIPAFYNRLGWQDSLSCFKVSDICDDCGFEYKLRPIDFEGDCSSLMEIYKNYTGRFNGPIVRDHEFYWKNWVKTETKNSWVVEDKENRVIAYISMEGNEEQLHVKEFGALPGYEHIFGGLISKVRSLMSNNAAEVKYSAVIQSDLKVKTIEEGRGMMVRLVTPFSCGGKLINTTQELQEVFKGEGKFNPKSDYLFWSTDNF